VFMIKISNLVLLRDKKRLLFRKNSVFPLLSQLFFHIVVPQAVMAIHPYVLKTMNCVSKTHKAFLVDLSKSWISKQLFV